MSTPLRLACFADCATQLLERALEQTLSARGYSVTLRAWPFTSPLQVQGELADFAPDHVLIWWSAEAATFPDPEPVLALPYPFTVYTMATRDDGAYGSLALITPTSLRAQILAWNARLIALAQRHPNLHLLDLDLIQSRLGRHQTYDPRLWEAAAMALTPTAISHLARHTADHLCAQYGALRKVLVTDLDGTLWDGIVSEDGVAQIHPEGPGRKAYRAWLKQLAARGILLAVASRNDRDLARAAFDHPEMELTPDDFLAFEADWGDKPSMLRRIANQLHVGLEALVFIDDRPEQRAEVRATLPAVAVPEMPSDPARWPEFLAEANLFEVAQLTDDDTLRAQTLRAEAERHAAAQTLSPDDYLASLHQELIPEPLDESNRARAAQLTQRCNQFNMRGTRHTEADLIGKRGWVYRLRDRFGDMGYISAVILDGPTIATWVISCRALNRGIEPLILAHLKTLGPVYGTYRPTDRNGRCQDLYTRQGIPPPPETGAHPC